MNDFKKRRVKKNLFFTVFVSFRRSLRDYGEEKIAIFKINFGLDQVWIKFVRCLNFTTFGNESTLTFSHGTWRKDIFGENDFRTVKVETLRFETKPSLRWFSTTTFFYEVITVWSIFILQYYTIIIILLILL